MELAFEALLYVGVLGVVLGALGLIADYLENRR